MRGRDTYGVDQEFVDSVHGQVGCINCHMGENIDDREKAHEGLVKDPSEEDGGGACRQCHADITSTYKNAMHYNLTGIKDIVGTLIVPHQMQDTLLPAAWDLDCANCHASCGSCHVAWPKVAEGGLLYRHRFQKTPPMEKTCYACHGSRFAGEYMGLLGPSPDVHYEKYQMVCTDCHKGSELHHTEPEGAKRYYATETPRCEQCHPDVATGKSQVAMHNAHEKGELACTVCHATEYFNCVNCHVSLDVKEDPYKYNLVRHTPMKKDSLASLRYFQAVLTGTPGPKDLISNYDALPTWNSASVHTIQRKTKQNSSCNACHGNRQLFLTKDDLMPGDPKANLKILVNKIPPEVKE
ncbi:MAG: hypothetical protein P8Y85_06085 [Nitrospirota bacterium]